VWGCAMAADATARAVMMKLFVKQTPNVNTYYSRVAAPSGRTRSGSNPVYPAIYFLTAGAAGGFAGASGALAGAAVVTGCAWSYSFTMSAMMLADGAAQMTGVCWLLTSSTVAYP